MKTPAKRRPSKKKQSRKPSPRRAPRLLKAVRGPKRAEASGSGPASSGADQLAALRERHLAEEKALLRTAFEQGQWSLAKTARRLGCRVTTLQRAVGRHEELEAIRAGWSVTRWGSLKKDAA